jgi:uncharacterized protein (TIGR00255 family)
MLRSMTGYGRSENTLEQADIVVEVKSSNHRYCDISLRMPQRCFVLEAEIKKLIQSHLKRGRIDLSIQIESREQEEFNIELNAPLAQRYFLLLKELKELLHLPEEITLNQVVTQKDIFMLQVANQNGLYDWEVLKKPIASALDALIEMREVEGSQLSEDFISRLQKIEQLLDEIQTIADETSAHHFKTLREKIQSLCSDIELDESRLVQEVAYLVEKSDIEEELVRARSHIVQFRQWLDADEIVGRKLEFLIQELHREVNTISSKSYHATISLKAVEIKNELERMREQVQNIE